MEKSLEVMSVLPKIIYRNRKYKRIEKAEKILKTNEFRVYPINLEDLPEDGWEYEDE